MKTINFIIQSLTSMLNGNNLIVTQQTFSLKFYVFLKTYNQQFDKMHEIF